MTIITVTFVIRCCSGHVVTNLYMTELAALLALLLGLGLKLIVFNTSVPRQQLVFVQFESRQRFEMGTWRFGDS